MENGKEHVIEQSEDFEAGYSEGFFDAVDTALRESFEIDEINAAADVMREFIGDIPEAFAEVVIEQSGLDCMNTRRRDEERFTPLMAEYRKTFPEEPMSKNDSDEGDHFWGECVGQSHGLLEGVLWSVERVCEKAGAQLDSDFALRRFWDFYYLAHKAFSDMLNARLATIQNVLQKACGSDVDKKIIPFPSRSEQ
jgi:hypothetical protein